MKCFVWLIVPLLSGGCASFRAREDDGARPYVGVRVDAYGLAHPSQANNWLEWPMCAFDLPLSFVLDTICLPYDVVQAKRTPTFDPRKK